MIGTGKTSVFWIIFLFLSFFLLTVAGAEDPAKATSDKPNVGEILFKKGLDAYQMSQFETAVSFLEQAIEKILPKQGQNELLVTSYLYLGRCYVTLEKLERAKDSFSMALSLNESLEIDEKTDPPKIILFFKKVKADFMENQAMKKRLALLEQSFADKGSEDKQAVREEVVSAPNQNQAGPKPWYKKWWVYGIGAAVIGGTAYAMSASSGEDNPEKGDVSIRWF